LHATGERNEFQVNADDRKNHRVGGVFKCQRRSLLACAANRCRLPRKLTMAEIQALIPSDIMPRSRLARYRTNF
jgi:hypothetical protein